MGLEKKYKKKTRKKIEKRTKHISRLDLSTFAFWCKKVEQCKIKIKKTKPTPKSMTHKKPIKISASSSNNHQPKRTR